jgi:hypothetical protein
MMHASNTVATIRLLPVVVQNATCAGAAVTKQGTNRHNRYNTVPFTD